MTHEVTLCKDLCLEKRRLSDNSIKQALSGIWTGHQELQENVLNSRSKQKGQKRDHKGEESVPEVAS